MRCLIITHVNIKSSGAFQNKTAMAQVCLLPWRFKPLSQHFTINSQKDEELTFVANGNRSQAKEEEGEKIHSVHLREEREGKVEGQQGGVRRRNIVHASTTDQHWKRQEQ